MKKSGHILLLICLILLLPACGLAPETNHIPTWQEQYDLGVRYLEDGDYEEAIIAFTAAIEIDPKRAEAYNQLARVYLAMDDPDRAEAVLEQGVAATGDEGLRTQLEELRETELTQSGPRTERQDNEDGSYHLMYFGEAGLLMRVEHYLPDGTICDISYFDEAGNGTRIEFYAPDGMMTSYAISCYDEAGKLARIEEYSPDGMLRDISYYDEAGNLTRHEAYQSGMLWETTEY